MLVKTYGSAVYGIHATIITIEVNIGRGVNFFLVGLPDSAVKESHHRIDAALKNNGYKIPGKGITVNMAPADIKKEGSAYDLPIALGILAASEQMKEKGIGDYVIMGELSLDGSLQPVKGVLPIAVQTLEAGFKGIILPRANANEAAMVEGLEVLGVNTINEVIDFFNGNGTIAPTVVDAQESFYAQLNNTEVDFSDVKGQLNIKRAFEIAAAGGHNIMVLGDNNTTYKHNTQSVCIVELNRLLIILSSTQMNNCHFLE